MQILTADIGGTNSRFALFEGSPLRLIAYKKFSSQETSFTDILQKVISDPSFITTPIDLFVLAIAGPVHTQQRVQPSNLPYPIAKEELQRICPHTIFINDCEAQAWSCLTTAVSDATLILQGNLPKTLDNNKIQHLYSEYPGRIGIIGSGTGLGMAVLEIHRTHHHVIPSEGGHTAFPFITKKEEAFAHFLCKKKNLNYIRGDDVVSGSGLAFLHEFLTNSHAPPHEITQLTDFAISETCIYVARFYARMCRSLALFNLTEQGIILTGGLAAKTPILVQHPAFKEEFIYAIGEHKKMLSNIPIWLNDNDTSGLWGAAYVGLQHLSTGT